MAKSKHLFIAILLAFIGYYIGSVFFSPTHAALIACITLLVALWTNEALPLGIVSLLPLIMFPASGLLTTKEVAANYANPIVFLFLGGFMLAIATQKTGLHKVIAQKILNIFPA